MRIKSLLILLAINTWLLAYINADPIMGQIKSVDQIDKIAVESDESLIYVVFYWDEEINLWVNVKGQTGDPLGVFVLANGNQITLKGGGKFTMEVYSVGGIGNWEVEIGNTSEADSEVH